MNEQPKQSEQPEEEEINYEEIFNVGVIPYDFSKTGRRTKCTAEVIEQIGILIAKGSSYVEAALLSGISESVFYRWMTRGRKEQIRIEALGIEDKEDYPEFAKPDELPFLKLFETVNKAIPLRKAHLLNRIRDAGKDPRNWQANAWMLERMHPDEFGRKTRVDVKQIDWRDEVVQLIRQGIPYDIVAEKVGDTEARELFERAGVEVVGGGASHDAHPYSQDDSGFTQE